MHNIAFLFHLIDQIRYHIAEGTFLKFKEDFLKKYQAWSGSSKEKYTAKKPAQ